MQHLGNGNKAGWDTEAADPAFAVVVSPALKLLLNRFIASAVTLAMSRAYALISNPYQPGD